MTNEKLLQDLIEAHNQTVFLAEDNRKQIEAIKELLKKLINEEPLFEVELK